MSHTDVLFPGMLLHTYRGECEGYINLMLVAYAQDVGTELNKVYLEYSAINAVM